MEEIKVKNIVREFLDETIPEFIVDVAHELISHGGVQKVSLQKDPTTWEFNATIQGDNLQSYNPRLQICLKEGVVNYHCDCSDSFMGPCKHVAAATLKLLSTLEVESNPDATPTTMLAKQKDWRQTFRPLFSNEIEPEVGKYYLVLRFFPEPGRLQVAFYRGRQNKSGLSNVQSELTIEQIINTPAITELSPDLTQVISLIGQHEDYFGHRITIPDGLLTWFLWSVRKEYYLFWKDTDIPFRIEDRTMQLRFRPEFTEDNAFTFSILLQKEGKRPVPIAGTETTLHGHVPLWVQWQHCFYPVHSTIDSRLVQELISQPLYVPQEDLSEFLDRVWSKLPNSALYEQESFLNLMEPYFVQASYNPKLFLDEEGSLLTLEIHNVYETIHGEVSLAGPNSDLQTGSYSFEGKTYLIKRSQEEEAALINMLLEIKFQPRNSRIWFIEPDEAVNFLLDVYPVLIQKYRVFGESALNKYKVRLSQPVISAEMKSNEEEKWFSLDISIEYEGQNIALEKIWQAWTQGKRYVQLRDGSYTSLPKSWLERVSHKLQALGFDPTEPPKKQFALFEAPILDSLLDDLPGTQTDSFWNKLQEKIRTFKEITPIPAPNGLNATLRAYQLQGLSYLNFLHEYNFGGILADEMGLGKTVQTLSFIQHMVEQGNTQPNLIIVPTSVLPNWEREAKKFVPNLSCLSIYGTRRENMFKKIDTSNLVLTTYTLLRRDLEELEKYTFNLMILDEAQNIKNPNTITAKSVQHIKANMRLCLSGTPIENNLFELWSLFEFLMPGFLGAQSAFKRGIVKPIQDGDNETLNYLRTRVNPFILRRTKAEVAKDLPPKVENITYCGLEEEQASLYALLAKKLKEQVMSTVDKNGIGKSQMSILDALLKLRQICCHPRLLKIDIPGISTNLPSGKFETFKDMVVDIVEEGHRVLVFSQFVQMLQIIRSWLQITEMPFCYLDGTTKDRFQQVDRFNEDPSIPIFLISLKAGGTGLNLTSADYVIHYDPWWNPAVENQATDRSHRIGQTKQVFSYKLICQNTVEEKILSLQSAKKDVADSIIPGAESFKTLSREDLEMLFEV